MTENDERRTAGVLALQGDFAEHERMLRTLGVDVVRVRRATELAGLDALVVPGGESTAMGRLIDLLGLTTPLRDFIGSGKPVYGSCAGMILLADRLVDPATDQRGRPQLTLGGLDVLVRRNAFGRQRESFETMLDFDQIAEPDRRVHAVFIRAPWVEEFGESVTPLAFVRIDGQERAVAVRQGNILATSFHPEATGVDRVAQEKRIHQLFVSMMRKEA